MNASIIDTVIRDLELEQKGAALYYAVDADDVKNYCFPIESHKNPNLDEIANQQAGWDQVFRLRKIKPLLPREYFEELDAQIEFVSRNISKHDKNSVLSRLIQLTQQSTRVLADVANPNIRKEDVRDFNIALMMHLGLYNIGLERLHWARQRFENPANKDVREVLSEITRDYLPTSLVGDIAKYLINSRSQSITVEEMEHSVVRDAAVIDRLLFVNRRLVAAYPDRLKSLHIILYLSSAERTRRVFELDMVRSLLPLIDGQPYSFHRTFEHPHTLLVFAVENPDEASQSHAASIERLKTIRDLLRWNTLNRLNRHFSASNIAKCPKCIQEGGSEEDSQGCSSLERCKAAKDFERLRVNQGRNMSNWGLLSKIQSYANLAVGSAKSVERVQLDKLQQFFKDTLNDAGMQDRVLSKMVALQKLMRIQMEFKEFTYYVQPLLWREDSELVRYQAHFFDSTVFNRAYGEIVNNIVALEQLFFDEIFNHYEQNVTEFLNLESTIAGLNAEHEIVRGLLYLCAPTNSGEQYAYRHSVMLEQEFKTGPLRDEILFFASWCSICIGRFDEARMYASEGTRYFPIDARFPHLAARANIREIRSDSAGKRREALINEAILLQQKSVRLAEDDPENIWLRGVMYNSLAFYLCHVDWTASDFLERIAEARKALDQLKRYINKEGWHPGYSNFFHTEALLEYNEGLAAQLDARQMERLAKIQDIPEDEREGILARARVHRERASYKFKRASVEIEEARKYAKKLRYEGLREDIRKGRKILT